LHSNILFVGYMCITLYSIKWASGVTPTHMRHQLDFFFWCHQLLDAVSFILSETRAAYDSKLDSSSPHRPFLMVKWMKVWNRTFSW
jgi:hypothetical protein